MAFTGALDISMFAKSLGKTVDQLTPEETAQFYAMNQGVAQSSNPYPSKVDNGWQAPTSGVGGFMENAYNAGIGGRGFRNAMGIYNALGKSGAFGSNQDNPGAVTAGMVADGPQGAGSGGGGIAKAAGIAKAFSSL